MKHFAALMIATLLVGTAHSEELTFVASGPVQYITTGGETLGGRLANAVHLNDEVRFFYTFESTTPSRQPYADPGYLIYGSESQGIYAIKRVRVEVSGNVWEFVPCGAPIYCSGRILLNDDYWTSQYFMDLYRVNAVESYDGVLYQVVMDLYTASDVEPIASLSSTDLPLVPPAVGAFQNRQFTLTSFGSPAYQIAVWEVSTLQFVPPDDSPPAVSGVFAAPNPVAVGTDSTLTATISDSDTGGSRVASAEYRVDGGALQPMTAEDGVFDSATEVVRATLPTAGWPAGVYEVCVRGTDEYDHASEAGADPENSCTLVVVYDASGGFVTGGGWIYSDAGACRYDLVCNGAAGKANFGFVSRYRKGASIPTGDTEFQFSAGGINFHSQAYDWLVVNAVGGSGQFKGSGTINGNLGPAGEAYRFMIWARDGSGGDSFRIKIWYVDAGIDVAVYDNGFEQPIGGGNIVVHMQ